MRNFVWAISAIFEFYIFQNGFQHLIYCISKDCFLNINCWSRYLHEEVDVAEVEGDVEDGEEEELVQPPAPLPHHHLPAHLFSQLYLQITCLRKKILCHEFHPAEVQQNHASGQLQWTLPIISSIFLKSLLCYFFLLSLDVPFLRIIFIKDTLLKFFLFIKFLGTRILSKLYIHRV